VHGAVVGYLFCLRFDRGVVHSVVVGYLYCLRFDRGGMLEVDNILQILFLYIEA
jgi:hypothetical protein